MKVSNLYNLRHSRANQKEASLNDLFAVAGILMIDHPRCSYFDFNSDTAIADAEEGSDIRHPAAQEVGSCKRHGSCGRSALDISSRCFGPDARVAPAIRGALEWRAATVRRDSFKVTYAAFGIDATKQVRLLPTPSCRMAGDLIDR